MYKQKYLTALLIVLSLFLIASLVVSATGKEENSGMYSAEHIKRGEYLVVAGGCHDCHSPKLFTPNGPEPDPERLLSGFPEGTKLPLCRLIRSDRKSGVEFFRMTLQPGQVHGV